MDRQYNEKCDIWSCGVIMYILLCGYPPFNGRSETEIMKNVKKGKYVMKQKDWEHVSPAAKSLMDKMLTYNTAKRISAQDALNDEWIKGYNEVSETDMHAMHNTLKNMKSFRADQKIQIATWCFLTNLLSANEDKQELMTTFRNLDTNGDGYLTKQELLSGFEMLGIYGNAETIIDNMMSTVDIDKNGLIEYSEFVMATINREKLLRKDRLEAVFRIFDQDGNGFISINELKEVFSGDKKIPMHVWEDMLKEADENDDGTISYYEFKKMMEKLLS